MACFIPEKLYGVIGWPLGHSLSPLLHNTAFQALKMPSVYMAWPLAPGELRNFMDGMRALRIQGCSVTIPHKIAVLSFLDNVSEDASLAGAVNTLFWRDGNLCGENTDVAGFLAPLKNLFPDAMDALLLGAGGAAHAAGAALRLRGCQQVRVASPGNQRQYSLAERFGFEAIRWQDRYLQPARLIINATPLGMSGANAGETPYDFALGPKVKDGFAYDLVYNPLKTIFLEQAEKAGRQIISGLEMFFGQANAQFELWTRRSLPREARDALDKALGAR